jgi:hypothetical protein
VRLFPSSVEELRFENSRHIIRTYNLLPTETPMDINMDSFTREGFYFTLQDITRNRTQLVTTREYVKVVEIETRNQNLNIILEHLTEYMVIETEGGYGGILFLDLASLHTQVAGTRTEGFTQTETRTFPNLSNPDVSLIPHSITVGGNVLTLSDVTWSGGGEETIDYTRIAHSFTAHATYTRQGTRNVVLGYITVAEFSGVLSRIGEGERVYTALFIGEPINAPVLPCDEDCEYTNGAAGAGNDSEARESRPMNMGVLLGALAALGALGAAVWFFLLRGNVSVSNLQYGENSLDGDYVKIGRTKVSKSKYVIDLTPFTAEAKTSAFRVTFPRWTASSLNGTTITANYGSGTFQHEISYTKGRKHYQVDFDF